MILNGIKVHLAALAVLLCTAVLTAAEAVKVACIGDSITYGYGIADRAAESYPAKLQALLGDGYEVRNFGNSGRGVYLHSKRGEEMRGYRYMPEHSAALDWQPDIVICNLGINDDIEYTRECFGKLPAGTFRKDYETLLKDYAALPSKPTLYIWNKLCPLTPKHPHAHFAAPFLMQRDLTAVATAMRAQTIDMLTPLRAAADSASGLMQCDGIHPTSAGAEVIARTVKAALDRTPGPADGLSPVELPADIVAAKPEIWLCAGQSNMLWRLNQCPEYRDEAAKLATLNIWVWEFRAQTWTKLTPANAGAFSAVAVEFAIRRAQKTGNVMALLQVAAGGAPTEAFLSEPTMAAVDAQGHALYPTLDRIVKDRREIDRNAAFPCDWCKREYPRRKANRDEAYWWALSSMVDHGIARVKHLPLSGVLWYQGESNATRNIAPDVPLADAYMKDTLRAVVQELRPNADTPFLMVGLPVLNRPWAPYRAAQQAVCEETGALYIDTFSAGLGTSNDVHPKSKAAFANLILDTLDKAR